MQDNSIARVFRRNSEKIKRYGAKPSNDRYDKYGTVIFGRIIQKSIPGVLVY